MSDQQPPVRPMDKLPEGKFVWFNGEIIDSATAAVKIWSNVVHTGTGVLEGIRCYGTSRGPAVFRSNEHYRRMHRSAAHYGMKLNWSAEDLTAATVELLRREGGEHTYIRPLAYFGTGAFTMSPRGRCNVDTIIMTRPMPPFHGEDNQKKGIRVTISSWRRLPASSVPTSAKAIGHYSNSVLAAHQAGERGFDDAIMLAQDGNVAEAIVSNVFFVRDGQVYTNDLSSSILPGITRETVLELLREEGRPAIIKQFPLSELMEADEIFLTGTAAEVTPVREIDGRTFMVGTDSLAARLHKKYQDVTRGRSAPHERWLSFVKPE